MAQDLTIPLTLEQVEDLRSGLDLLRDMLHDPGFARHLTQKLRDTAAQGLRQALEREPDEVDLFHIRVNANVLAQDQVNDRLRRIDETAGLLEALLIPLRGRERPESLTALLRVIQPEEEK